MESIDGRPSTEYNSATFEEELTALINKYSIENRSNTPDFILAKVMIESLKLFEQATARREWWYRTEENADPRFATKNE